MTFKTHQIGAVATVLLVNYYYPLEMMGIVNWMGILIASSIGALLPDIDQESNRLWDLLPGGNMIGKLLKNIFLAHRTLSHSILGVILVFYGANWLIPRLFNQNFISSVWIIYGLMIGYLSHLALDGLTEEGLPLLFPIKWKFGIPPIRQWRIKTGGWFEKWVISPGLMLLIGYIILKQFFIQKS